MIYLKLLSWRSWLGTLFSMRVFEKEEDVGAE
jgi:hypothetical protein